MTRGHGWCHHCGMQMRYEYETGPDRNSGTGRLPSDYQEVSVQMMTPGDANALGWSYDEAMAARDAVQDERTAALDALAAENGIGRGDTTDDEPDGGVRPCERNLYGFCRTCGEDMGVSA